MQGAVAGKYEGSAPPRVKDIHSLALIGSSTQEQGKQNSLCSMACCSIDLLFRNLNLVNIRSSGQSPSSHG
jgi:hypothetical protein